MSVNILSVVLGGFGIIGPAVGAVMHETSALPVLANSARLVNYRGRSLIDRLRDSVLGNLKHSHFHLHEAITHTHSHVHSDGHHLHEHSGTFSEPHTHVHTHLALAHAHAHRHDIHHRHEHGTDRI